MADSKPGRKPGQKAANELQALEREDLVRELRLKGYSLRQIAKKVSISHETARAVVKKIEGKWSKASSQNLIMAINRDVERLGMVLHEAWKGWDGSLKLKTETTHATKVKPVVLKGKKPPKDKKESIVPTGPEQADPSAERVITLEEVVNSTKKIQRDGDPRFLQIIVQCIVEIHRLMGTYNQLAKGKLFQKETRPQAIKYQQSIYLPGLEGLELTPEMLVSLADSGQAPQDLWHLLESLLQNQQPHQWTGEVVGPDDSGSESTDD